MADDPRVGIVMGSDSDWPVMEAAAEALKEFGVAYEADVVSAHRMPDEMLAYGREAADRGLSVIIAGAGGAAHLPGMLAAVTALPVIGVPVPRVHLDGMDSLLSMVQMPAGVPVATVAIGNARNAGLLAVRILAASDADLRQRLARLLAGAGRSSVGRRPDVRPGWAPPYASRRDGGRRSGAIRGAREEPPGAQEPPVVAGVHPAAHHRDRAGGGDQGVLRAGLLHPVGLDGARARRQRPHPGREDVVLGR